MTETISPVAEKIDTQQLAQQLVERARVEGVDLVGPGGLLTGLTKTVLETALEAEMAEQVGYDKHDPAGRNGQNSRNGTRAKTVLTEVGPVEIEVPRDRDGSFDLVIVRKRQRRLDGIDQLVLSLTARGLTTGEIAAHFAEVYGAKVSKDTISRITDKVVEEMSARQARPLDRGADSSDGCESGWTEDVVPRYAPNKVPAGVKRRYFELIREGMPGAEAARQVGVSTSCGSSWFIDAGIVRGFEPTPISRRFLSQDDRIEIADGLGRGEPVKSIAARIGRSYQAVYRELARNCKPDGSYQPYYAHNQAYQRRRRPKPRRLAADSRLRELVVAKLRLRWSPEQIARWLRRRYFRRRSWHLCAETIYDSVYRGVLGRPDSARLRTGRVYRHRRGRGRTRDGALKQCTSMRSIQDREPGGRVGLGAAGELRRLVRGPDDSRQSPGSASVPGFVTGEPGYRHIVVDIAH